MAQHILRRDSGIHAKLLRQVPKPTADLIFLLEEVDIAQRHGAAVRLLQGSKRPHQGGFARAIRPQQAVHASRDRQGDVIKRFNAVLVSLGKILNSQFHAHALLVRRYWGKVSIIEKMEIPVGCGGIALFKDASANVSSPLKASSCKRPSLKGAYITLGAPIPISSRLWISARRTTAAVASRKLFFASSVSVRMRCLWQEL